MASCSLFRPEKPHFFKVIFAHSLTQHKLGIPPKFVKLYGHDLPSHVILKVPSGSKWRVDILKSEGEIWLQRGWREFADYYSVVVGSFLVFEYEKSASEFNVFIFDNTATEIDYPLTLSNGRPNNLYQEQVPQAPNFVVDDEPESDSSVEISPSKANLDQQTREKTLNQNGEAEVEQSVNRKRFTKAEKAKAIERAISDSQSQNPSFSIVMQPSYFTRHGFDIPSSFSRKYLNKCNGEAVLKILDGRSWCVKYYYSTSSGKFSMKCSGWTKCLQDNHLQLGDVCIFELLTEYVHEIVFRVTISKYSTPANLETTIEIPDEDFGQFSPSRKRIEISTLSSSNPCKKMKMVENFPRKTGKEVKKENKGLAYQKHMVNKILIKKKPLEENTSDQDPTFQIAIGRSHLHSHWSKLDIPARFSGKYMKRNKGNVVFNVLDGKTWSLKYCKREFRGQTRIKLVHSDWKKFVQGNSLKVGDTCSFELIDPENTIFRVIISKGREAKNLGKSKNLSGAKDIFLGNSSLSNSLEAVNQTFQIVMRQSHLVRGIVHVPCNFMKNMVRETRIAKLQVEDRIWPVKMVFYPEHGENRMFSGWVSFAKENSLKFGDVCSFELIDPKNLLIKVSIRRR